MAAPDREGPATSVEQQIAGFVADLGFADIPEAAQGALGTLLLDISACMLAGLGDPVTDKVRAQIVARGGAAESSLVGHGGKVPAPQAAWHNGLLAHWSEWDDTYDPGAVRRLAGRDALPAPRLDQAGRPRRGRTERDHKSEMIQKLRDDWTKRAILLIISTLDLSMKIDVSSMKMISSNWPSDYFAFHSCP